MSSLFGSGGASLGGAAPPNASGFLAGGSTASSLFGSSNVGSSVSASNTKSAPGLTGGGLFSSSFGNKATGTLLSGTSSTDGKISLFGGSTTNAASSSGLQTSNLLQGGSSNDSKPAGAGFVGGSLFGNTSGSLTGSTGVSLTSTLTAPGASTTNAASGGGNLFGAAGNKPFSLLGTGSVPTAAAGAGTTFASSSSSSSVSGADPSSTNTASTVNSSLFGTAQGTAKQPASSAGLFGSDSSKQAATSSNDSSQQAEKTGQSTLFGTSVESKTASQSGGLFGSSSQIPSISSSTGVNDTKTQDGVTTAATSAGGNTANRDSTVAGKGDGALLSLSSASRNAGAEGSLFGKSNLSSASSSALETNANKGGQTVPSASTLTSAAHSSSKDNTVPGTAASALPSPQEVALETLQHELLEDVLAKWERRLERRVGQFIAVAEEVESVEKAMIEESRKIQQLMNEQGKLERKQVYTARVIDSLEQQQRDLMTLLRSIESAVLEIRCGGPRDISSSGKNTSMLGNYRTASAVGKTRDPGMWYRLLDAGGEEAGPAAVLGEPDSKITLTGKSFTDQSTGVSSMPLLSSAEQLALERLRSFDQQLAEVGQNLSYTAETFQAGSLGAVAQVLAVHQAALRAAACQATQIGERMRQLQDVWEVSKSKPGGRSGILKSSG